MNTHEKERKNAPERGSSASIPQSVAERIAKLIGSNGMIVLFEINVSGCQILCLSVHLFRFLKQLFQLFSFRYFRELFYDASEVLSGLKSDFSD